jgi:transposase
METCSGSHQWARSFKELGHDVKLINAKRVQQFGTRNKNDFNDAKAITKAARDVDTYFVPIKTQEQQAVQAVHKLRDLTMRQRTATINSARAMLIEMGVAVSKGARKFIKQLPFIIEDAEQAIPFTLRQILQMQLETIRHLDASITEFDSKIKQFLKESKAAQRLKGIPGVGELVSTALECMIADPTIFKNGRHCAAWLGLTPKEHSTGGKQRLGKVSCEGNAYLRKIMVQGAQSMVSTAHKRDDRLSRWALKLKESKGNCVAAVAVANKIARIAWAILKNNEAYDYDKACLAFNEQ